MYLKKRQSDHTFEFVKKGTHVLQLKTNTCGVVITFNCKKTCTNHVREIHDIMQALSLLD